MSTPATVASYPSLRDDTWATDPVELESTLTVLVAGIWHILDAVAEAAPPVVPTSPIIDAMTDPDYSWDRDITPGRLYAFLAALATRCPHITPSAYIETFELVRQMFVFVWEHPIIVRNMVWELELLFMRTFWNVAVRYDKTFTEVLFDELTDHQYARRLDHSTNTILQRTMDLEDSKQVRPDEASWRKLVCKSYADYVDDVEAKHPYVDPAAMVQGTVTTGNWIDGAMSSKVIPSNLESSVDVEIALEETLSTKLNLDDEIEGEEGGLPVSDSNCAMYGTPTPIAYVHSYPGPIPDIVVSSPTEAGSTCDDYFDALDSMSPELDSAGEVPPEESLSPVEGLEVSDPLSIHLPSGLTVRSRPQFGPAPAPGSEASSDEDSIEISAPLGPWTSEEIYVLDRGAYLFSPELDEEEDSEEEEVPSPSSSGFGRFFRGSIFSTASSKGTWKSTTNSSTNSSSISGSSVPTQSSRTTTSSRSKDPPAQPLSKRLGSSFRAFLRRRGIIRRKLTSRDRVNCSVFWEQAHDGPPMIGRDGHPVSMKAAYFMKTYMPAYYWQLRRTANEEAGEVFEAYMREIEACERKIEAIAAGRRPIIPSILSFFRLPPIGY